MASYGLVLLTAAIAFVAWLIQRALNRADEQRRVASRIRAYLMYWHRCAIQMNGAGFLLVGQTWYEEVRAVYKAGGGRDEVAKKLVEVDNKYQSAERFKSELAGTTPPSKALQELRAGLAKYEKARREVTDHLYQLRRELVEGHTFVRDGDLAVLDVPTVQAAVELRLLLASLIGSLVSLLQSVEMLEGSHLDEALQNLVVNALVAGVRVSYQMKFLMTRCEYYLKRKRLDAIKENLGA